jgi:hypothetical protein
MLSNYACTHPNLADLGQHEQLNNYFMEFHNSKAVAVKPRTALVQGESFRCVAVEIRPGHWRKLQDGAELPPVLDVVSVLDGAARPRSSEICPATATETWFQGGGVGRRRAAACV